jgi:hypothetical protein
MVVRQQDSLSWGMEVLCETDLTNKNVSKIAKNNLINN